jgi:transposase
MSAPKKYEQEFQGRAVRMYRERLAESGESKRSARRHVVELERANEIHKTSAAFFAQAELDRRLR